MVRSMEDNDVIYYFKFTLKHLNYDYSFFFALFLCSIQFKMGHIRRVLKGVWSVFGRGGAFVLGRARAGQGLPW